MQIFFSAMEEVPSLGRFRLCFARRICCYESGYFFNCPRLFRRSVALFWLASHVYVVRFVMPTHLRLPHHREKPYARLRSRLEVEFVPLSRHSMNA